MKNGNLLVMQTGQGGRYSLLVHHTQQELIDFGLTPQMLDDQIWQKTAKPGELNYDYLTNGPSFFTHLMMKAMVYSAKVDAREYSYSYDGPSCKVI
ncbi:hypothetical protein HanRHA438_Chr13g0587891 [Helianthus annuus]|nr:hypothetical protein HanRHA438_Chr13g0587891 [Helianthus annuus]